MLPPALPNECYPPVCKPAVHRVVLVQLLVTLLVSALLLVVRSSTAVSALLGGLCCSIPTGYFIRTTFRYHGARAARLIVSAFYQGELGKFIMTVLVFTLVFTQVKSIEPMAFFSVFMLAQSVHWFTPLMVRCK